MARRAQRGQLAQAAPDAAAPRSMPLTAKGQQSRQASGRELAPRRPGEQVLGRGQQLYQTLARHFPNGSINVFDRELRYLFAEGQGLTEVGLSPQSLVGKRLEELFPPESVEYVAAYYARAFAGETVEFELPLQGRVYSITAAPLHDDDRAVDAIIAVAHDITERKQAEVALQTAQERFRLLVATLTHDIKNPLTSVKGRAQLLLRRASRDPARAEDIPALTEIERQANNMRRLLDQLMDMARREMGEALALRRTAVDLRAVVERLVEQFQAGSDQHQIRIQDEHSGALVGHLDADRIEQVVANLLSNAVKYSPAGGTITVGLRREEGDGAGRAVLWVEDEGLGIPAADLPHVFEPFRRGSNVADRILGMGIGLAGVRQIVELHGGVVTVESQEGVGSRFTVRLPLAGAAAEG